LFVNVGLPLFVVPKPARGVVLARAYELQRRHTLERQSD